MSTDDNPSTFPPSKEWTIANLPGLIRATAAPLIAAAASPTEAQAALDHALQALDALGSAAAKGVSGDALVKIGRAFWFAYGEAFNCIGADRDSMPDPADAFLAAMRTAKPASVKRPPGQSQPQQPRQLDPLAGLWSVGRPAGAPMPQSVQVQPKPQQPARATAAPAPAPVQRTNPLAGLWTLGRGG